jgi:hypothetical protein
MSLASEAKFDQAYNGQTQQREPNQLPYFELYQKVYKALKEANTTDLSVLASAAVMSITGSPRKRLLLEHLALAEGKPTCGICDLRIYLDQEDPSSPDYCTVDHIVRWADGGKYTLENTRLAHKLCNESRHTITVGRTLRPIVRRRIQTMQEYLLDRMYRETLAP